MTLILLIQSITYLDMTEDISKNSMLLHKVHSQILGRDAASAQFQGILDHVFKRRFWYKALGVSTLASDGAGWLGI